MTAPTKAERIHSVRHHGLRLASVSLEHQHVRSAAVVLAPDEHFKESAKEALRVQPDIEHVTS
jgi:hypothetical protein